MAAPRNLTSLSDLEATTTGHGVLSIGISTCSVALAIAVSEHALAKSLARPSTLFPPRAVLDLGLCLYPPHVFSYLRDLLVRVQVRKVPRL